MQESSMIGTIQGGRYRIVRRLGEGGMGEVYLAEHVNLGRREALKIVHHDLAHDPQFVSRFRREARATNRLQHPNIVSMYDFGRLEDGRYFLSMEYADGEPLSHLLYRSGPMPVPRMLRLFHQLASAIDHAHGRGVVHRDLRPDNIIIETTGSGGLDKVRVLDFGLAKIIAPDYIESIGLSQKGQIFGTPAYMAPEQFRGISDDPRIDIYALGCIAFELLTGSAPFIGRPMEVMSAQVNRAPEPPSRRHRKGNIPEALDALVLHCLEKDPAQRLPNGKELLAAIERMPGFSRAAPPGARLVRRRAPLDFDQVDTEVTPPPGTPQLGPDGTPTGEPPPWCQRLREIAESFLDSGGSDVTLVMELARIKEIEDDLVRAQEELAALDRQAGSLERSARQRESSLRFAIGELLFVKTEEAAEGAEATPDLDRQITELERRLALIAKEIGEELEVLTDHAVSVAAVRAGLQEKAEAVYHSIERQLDQAAKGNADGSRTLARQLGEIRELRRNG